MRFQKRVSNWLSDYRVRKALESNANRPLYHIHLRKTAGTTLNVGLIQGFANSDSDSLYDELAQAKNHRIITSNGRVIVGWNKYYIESGQYDYAFSHIPWHQLDFKRDVVTFTCLRNPVDRLISHYKMLMHYKMENINHPCMQTEGKWLGNGFDDFLERIPATDLMAQLFCFSENFNVDQAVEAITSVDIVLDLSDLTNDIKKIEKITGFDIKLDKYKSFQNQVNISDDSLNRLNEKLAPDIEFYNRVRSA